MKIEPGRGSQLSGSKPELLHAISLKRAIESALSVAKRRGERAFVVGGVVRDLLRNGRVGDADLDVVVEGDGLSFAKDLSEGVGGTLTSHPKFLTAKLVAPFGDPTFGAEAAESSETLKSVMLTEIDVATSREEVYEASGALPSVRPGPIERDLFRRDFSINALALPLDAYFGVLQERIGRAQLESEVLDPCGGQMDLQGKVVRVLHKDSFWDDPTRLFRCNRYCHRLGFLTDALTQELFLQAVGAGVLRSVSGKRVWNESVTALDEENPGLLLERFFSSGLYAHHPLLTEESVSLVRDALERLSAVKGEVPVAAYRDGAVLVLLSCLVEDDPKEILVAAQVSKVVRREAMRLVAFLKGGRGGETGDLPTVPMCAAAFALTGVEDHLTGLLAAINRTRG